jgi:hypothetical protein
VTARIALFVEGHTEFDCLPKFLQRWLAPKVGGRIEFIPVRMDGAGHFRKEIPQKVRLQFAPPEGDGIVGAIGLLDLYGYPNLPDQLASVAEKYDWAKAQMEQRVADQRFKQHFAVHELEAWLLANPDGFPREVSGKFPPSVSRPEDVNFDEPPAKLLERLYWEAMTRHYRKRVDGRALFANLDPDVAYQRCPYLARMLDDMLALAKAAGL